MILQAASSQRLISTDQALAAQAMQSVQDAGRQAMTELGRLLTVLRSVSNTDTEPVSGTADRLSTLHSLTERVEAAGVAVNLNSHGHPGRLDPSVDLAAYRVVQESLTNVSRYAGPGSAVDVNLRWSPSTLEIEILDDGAGMPDAVAREISSGFGFVGLRERITLIGGQIHTEPVDDGGYRVAVTLPAKTS